MELWGDTVGSHLIWGQALQGKKRGREVCRETVTRSKEATIHTLLKGEVAWQGNTKEFNSANFSLLTTFWKRYVLWVLGEEADIRSSTSWSFQYQEMLDFCLVNLLFTTCTDAQSCCKQAGSLMLVLKYNTCNQGFWVP